jgi:hypothetical protein
MINSDEIFSTFDEIRKLDDEIIEGCERRIEIHKKMVLMHKYLLQKILDVYDNVYDKVKAEEMVKKLANAGLGK